MQVSNKASFTPRRFGKYLLLDRIGRGGMAEVYRSKTYGTAGFVKECAIKKILSTLIDDEQFVRMFIDEAKLTAFLTHPNIVQVLDLGEIEGHLFIAMEYVPGKDLLDVLARSARRGVRIPIELTLYIVMEMLKGLDFAHKAVDAKGQPMGIVHRDVSPSNILISYDGQVKVGDFGIAKSQMQSSKTEVGTQKGKTGYMSPEQVTGSTIDGRSDLFAAAVILFELLTMTRLFKAKSDLDVMIKIRDADIEGDLERAARISPGLSEVIRRGLRPNVDERYQTAEEFLDDLRDYAHDRRIKTSAAALSAYVSDLFQDKIEAERRRRKDDPEDASLAEAPSATARALFRYRDREGVIHGPMLPDMMIELLQSRSPNQLEAISFDGGQWRPLSGFAEFADLDRPDPGETPAPSEALEADAMNASRAVGSDWEEVSLAGVNPRRGRSRTGGRGSGVSPAIGRGAAVADRQTRALASLDESGSRSSTDAAVRSAVGRRTPSVERSEPPVTNADYARQGTSGNHARPAAASDSLDEAPATPAAHIFERSVAGGTRRHNNAVVREPTRSADQGAAAAPSGRETTGSVTVGPHRSGGVQMRAGSESSSGARGERSSVSSLSPRDETTPSATVAPAAAIRRPAGRGRSDSGGPGLASEVGGVRSAGRQAGEIDLLRRLNEHDLSAGQDLESATCVGPIGDVSLFRVLHRLAQSGARGRLRVSDGDAIVKDLYIADGLLVGAESTADSDSIVELLRARNAITREQAEEATALASQSGAGINNVLLQLRSLAPHELFHFLQELLAEKLFTAVFWLRGDWSWFEGDTLEQDAFATTVPLDELLARTISERAESRYFRRFYKQRRRDRLVAVLETDALRDLRLSARTMRILTHLDTTPTIADIVRVFADRYNWPEAEVYRNVYALTEYGVVRFEGEREVPLPG